MFTKQIASSKRRRFNPAASGNGAIAYLLHLKVLARGVPGLHC